MGVIENIDLPELGLFNIAARIDTGAQTSALHVDHISTNKPNGEVSFEFHPDVHNVERVIKCQAKLQDTRWVRSSNGERERRYVIRTQACMGPKSWEIELTLTDRSTMSHLMLLGREAMQIGVLVDPENTFLLSK
ncbi:ATP-dependent zinc protease [Alteromonas sp. a30]|nr:ATP-dependent zinc protease [Alteromonas sp. a30]